MISDGTQKTLNNVRKLKSFKKINLYYIDIQVLYCINNKCLLKIPKYNSV